MSNKHIYLFNPDIISNRILTIELKKGLLQSGLISELDLSQDIVIKELNSNATNKELNINIDLQIEKAWIINLEKEINGITPKSSTAESAILLYEKLESTSKIHILLIELKSSLQPKKMSGVKVQPSTLSQCEKKINSSINRILMLLGIANENNIKKGYYSIPTYLVLHSLISFERENNLNDNDSELEKLYKNDKSIYSFASILNHEEKIFVKFTKSTNLNLSEIINCSQQSVIVHRAETE